MPLGPPPLVPLPPLAAACARRDQRVRVVVVLEEFLHPAAPLLEPVQREGQVRDRVADDVVRCVAREIDQQRPFVPPGLEAAPAEFGQQLVGALVDVDEQDLAHLGHAGDRVGPQQRPASIATR